MRVIDFLMCLRFVIPMAWRITSDQWEFEVYADGGFSAVKKNTPTKEE